MKRKGKDYAERKDSGACRVGKHRAYKIASLASALKKLQANVHVLMTENATRFINPITFETLTGNKCLIDTFDGISSTVWSMCLWQNRRTW